MLVSALIFSRGRLSWLREAWCDGIIAPVVCKETASELIQVLKYPKFKLTAVEQEDLLSDFLPYAQTFVLVEGLHEVVQCRDPDGQIFLSLAGASGAAYLVSGDPDLLILKEDFSPLIVSPVEFRDLCLGKD